MTNRTNEVAPSVDVLVGAAVHQHMWLRRMSQAEMGRALGVSQSVVSKKLRGMTGISLTELMTIGRVLGVDPADLLPRGAEWLPRLDSNQQPSGYPSPVVSLHAHRRARTARHMYRLAVAS